MDKRTLSVCIPTKNSFEVTLKSFADILHDERIFEFVIVDDFSQEIFMWKWSDWLQFDAPENKVKLCQNEMSLGTSLNKQRAVIFADTEYIVLLDPNKVITTYDLDYIYLNDWDEETISQFIFGEFCLRKKWLERFDEEQKMMG